MARAIDILNMDLKNIDDINVFTAILKRYVGRYLFVNNFEWVHNEIHMNVGLIEPFVIQIDNEKLISGFKHNELFIAKIIPYERTPGGKIILPYYEEIKLKVERRHNNIIKTFEQVLVDITSEKLLNIPYIENQLNPFREITLCLLDDGQISDKTLKRLCTNKNMKRYADLLIELELIESRRDGTYVPGNMFVKIKTEYSNKREILQHVMKSILCKGYWYLVEYMNFKGIESYTHMINTYYLPSYKCQRLLIFNYESLKRVYKTLYRHYKSEHKIKSQCQNLIDAGIFKAEDDHIIGQQDVYDDMKHRMKGLYGDSPNTNLAF